MWGMELSKAWLMSSMPFPVDPTAIALEITNRRFEDKIANVKGHTVSGIEGILTKSKSANEWFILFDETIETPGRIKFTISHELGHYLLHREISTEFLCDQSSMLDYGSPESKLREKDANEFASFLLMPLMDYREQIRDQEITLDLIAHCARRYDVSVTACALKWVQFTDEVAVVVMIRDDFVLWSYPSANARKLGIHFNKGKEVSSKVLLDLNQGSKTDKNVRRPPGIWHAIHESLETHLVSDKYEMGIVLIRFPYATSNTFVDEQEFDSMDFIENKNKGFTKR